MNLHPINGTTTVYSNDRVTEHKVFKNGQLVDRYTIDAHHYVWKGLVFWPFHSNRQAYLWILDNT
jgi:hypothetical protein